MKLSDFKVLPFDCYGTLIDWESGILKALLPLTNQIVTGLTTDQILEAYARQEGAMEAQNPRMLYSDLLTIVHQRLAEEWGIKTNANENRQFAASIKDWPAFPDSVAALRYLKQYFKLVILSNVDRRSFHHSNEHLGVEFDQIYTAEEIGSYKPDLRNFEYLLSKLATLGYRKPDILHTAESLYHDHAPANRFGVASAWIHRRHGQSGSGATTPLAIMPTYNFRFTSMAEMVAAHARELTLGQSDASKPH